MCSLVCPGCPYLVSFKRDLEFPNLLFFKNDQLLNKLALCFLCIFGAESLESSKAILTPLFAMISPGSEGLRGGW